MKKKFLLALSIVLLFVCVFALSISAETVLKAQDSNAYGELSFFDESITVGRTNTHSGFVPYIDADGTEYARLVIGDGTTYYTFPTAYVLSNSQLYGSSGKIIFAFDIASLNTAMETATGKNPNWTKSNIYRMELPYGMTRFNGGNQNVYGFTNLIELRLQPDSSTHDTYKNCLFHSCYNLEVIYNLETFVFKTGCLSGSFQNCYKLKNITLGVHEDITSSVENMFKDSGVECVNFIEAFPNLKALDNGTFQGCKSLKSISSNDAGDGTIIIPESITAIGQSTFENCDAVKYISLPSTLTKIQALAFSGCDSLLFVDFNDNQNVIHADYYGQFLNCTSLLAVSLPDNYTYIPNRMFVGCKNIKALCLPKNLVRVDTNGWSEDPFNGCNNLYFVAEPFEVTDENGNFYTKESFKMPEKPSVYYMPETLEALCTNKSSGKCFTQCYNLNPFIVFGEKVTKITTADGIFLECGSNGTLGSSVAAVFLGDMEQICLNTNGNRCKGIKYIFVNENDTDLSKVNIINNTTNGYNLNDKTEGFYFCHGNCYYLLNGVKYNGTYSDSVLTKVEGAIHFANDLMAETTPADCLTNAFVTNKCFCGEDMGTEEVENSALGHSHTVYLGLIYKDFSKAGAYSYQCERCDDVNNDNTAPALFVCRGYSAPEFGAGGITVGFEINREAIAAYTEATGKTVKYGVFAVLQEKIGDNSIFDENGNAAAGVICGDLTRQQFAVFAIKIVGFKNDEQKSAKLAMGGYVAVSDENGTEYSYMQDDSIGDKGSKYCFASFNDVIANLAVE
ncbi:MAG: leucine-rich repeat domain-containing protein [Clostridia bacterium]|nr:leucine-rich repeat domain-containing protein [Clostridia bacterium]